MKILVAGGAGYVGSVLVPLLKEYGYDVTVMDALWFGNHLPKDVPVIKKDLVQCTRDDLQGFDQVIFLSGLSNDPMAEYAPWLNFLSNGAQPSYLAYLAREAGVKRFIYGSSCSVYGYTVDELYDENAPATCGYPYGISKLQGERGVLQMQSEDFSVIALRKGTVSGHSPRMRFDLIVNAMYKSAMMDNKIVVNNPSIWRPIIDVRDVAKGYLRAIQANLSISGVFNLIGDNYTVGQVGDLVKEQVEDLTGHRVRVETKNMTDFRNYKVTADKAKTVLGFDARHSIDDIVESLFSNKDDYQDLNSDQYYNIKQFKNLNL